MANLLNLTSFTNPSQTLNGNGDGKTATAILINVNKIISVTTRPTAYLGTGITNVLYAYRINETETQVNLIVTQALSAVLASANAPLA